jgi:hypothetical protein
MAVKHFCDKCGHERAVSQLYRTTLTIGAGVAAAPNGGKLEGEFCSGCQREIRVACEKAMGVTT